MQKEEDVNSSSGIHVITEHAQIISQFQSLCHYKLEQLLIWQECSCESTRSRDKLVHVYVCQVSNCALKPLVSM